jgi:putative component of membrane protein insertase Oxa1/YidC/SpoIIIJ protein YidD
MNKKILLLSLLVTVGITLKSQDKKDLELVSKLFEIKSEKIDYKQFAKENPNEIQLIASGLFIFYKTFFSSQDGNRCVFHPSCSVYTIQSMKKNGVLIGFADGMDRLLRCNRLSPENYEKYKNTNLFNDPIH